MIGRIVLTVALVSTTAHGECVPPLKVTSAAISPQTATETYVTALDAYAACLRAEASTLPPLARYADLRASAAAYDAMQQAVDAYNAPLRRATSGP